MECLKEDAGVEERKSITFSAVATSPDRDDEIATSAILLDITYESYGFSGYLIETIN